jgi:exosome complex component CSL4
MTVKSKPFMFEEGSKVAPGDNIGSAKNIVAGKGCYIRGSSVYSSVVGTLTFSPHKEGQKKEYEASILLEKGRQYASSQVLTIGIKVLCKVLRIVNNMATVEIVAAEDIGSLREHHSGIIRKEDVRVGVTEEVQIIESFRPGDVVVAKIISLGDSRRYYLTTAENDLGVIRAICSSSREIMVPISWKEMQCPKTHVKELRKCAKPKV